MLEINLTLLRPISRIAENFLENLFDKLFAICKRFLWGMGMGYYDLVVDYRGLPTMQQFAPVVLDITHSLQQPNQASGVTGGKPAMIETIARAGVAVGVDGLFLETHFDPSAAKSDGANMRSITV